MEAQTTLRYRLEGEECLAPTEADDAYTMDDVLRAQTHLERRVGTASIIILTSRALLDFLEAGTRRFLLIEC